MDRSIEAAVAWGRKNGWRWTRHWMRRSMMQIRLEIWNWIRGSEKKGWKTLKNYKYCGTRWKIEWTCTFQKYKLLVFGCIHKSNATPSVCLHRCSWPWQKTSMASGQPLWWQQSFWFDGYKDQQEQQKKYTLPKTNMEPENALLEKEKHLQTINCLVPC